MKRSLVLDDDDDEDIFYNFKVLLPNGTSVKLTLKNPEPEISMQSFVNLVKKEYDNARKDCLLMSKRMKVDWNSGGKFHLESNGGKMKGIVRFAAFKPDLCHIIRLDVSCSFFVQVFVSFCSIFLFLIFSASISMYGSGRFWYSFHHV